MTIAEFLNELKDYANKQLRVELGLTTVFFDWQFHGIEKKKKDTTFYIELLDTMESEQLASRLPSLSEIKKYKKSENASLTDVTNKNHSDLLCEAKGELRFLVTINLICLNKIKKEKSRKFWKKLVSTSGYTMKYNPFY